MLNHVGDPEHELAEVSPSGATYYRANGVPVHTRTGRGLFAPRWAVEAARLFPLPAVGLCHPVFQAVAWAVLARRLAEPEALELARAASAALQLEGAAAAREMVFASSGDP